MKTTSFLYYFSEKIISIDKIPPILQAFKFVISCPTTAHGGIWVGPLLTSSKDIAQNEVEEEIYSVLWDFGGQLVYYATHPLFLTTKAIYCLVYNLSRDPAETVDLQVRPGFYKNIDDVFCEMSNGECLDVWMSSVSSLVPQDEDPGVLSRLIKSLRFYKRLNL